MVEIFYIPGLNTYGDGQIHVGPFRFGQMHSHISAALLKHDVRLVCYNERVHGSAKMVTLLGHSTGGLIARALAHQKGHSSTIKRIITIATPHLGTPLADRALSLPVRKKLLSKVMRAAGYDLKHRVKFFEKLTPLALKKFNETYPDIDTIAYYSILSAPKASELELVFRFLLMGAGLRFDSVERFDGIIPYESQKWGVLLGNLELDHLAQIGFFRHIISTRRRNVAKLQFDEMISLIASTVKMS